METGSVTFERRLVYSMFMVYFIFSAFLIPIFISIGISESSETTVSVSPKQMCTNHGLFFNVSIVVGCVSDLYAWQIKLLFNSTVLNATRAFYPEDHVFAGKTYFSLTPVINSTGGYILFGSSLLGSETTFDGNGALCQIEFLALYSGSSPFNFSRPLLGEGSKTFLLDSNLDFISIEAHDGEVFIDWPPIHDIAITNVSCSTVYLYQGETLFIDVDVLNEGNTLETSNVTTYYDSYPIETIQATLNFSESTRLSYVWNTTGITIGNYTISAYSHPVENETDISDNTFATGIVEITAGAHDVAITQVNSSIWIAYPDDIVTIYVDAENVGSHPETFGVAAYADCNAADIGDEIVVGTQTIELSSRNSTTLSFVWNTTDVAYGSYTISGEASPVFDEMNSDNNILVDDVIFYIEGPSSQPTFLLGGNFSSKVGSRFNATIWVVNVTDLFSGQFTLFYNATILDATRAWSPHWDPQYVFYDMVSFLPKPSLYSGWVRVHDSLLLAECFNGTGKLGIVEFEVMASGECTLAIDNYNTYLHDYDWSVIACTKQDGYFAVEHTPAIVDVGLSSPDITFSDENPDPGEYVTIEVEVHNFGDQDVDNVVVQFFDVSTLLGEQQIPLIVRTSGGKASLGWTASGEGFHLIRIVIDPYNDLFESDEANNEATRSILVGQWLFGGINLTGSLATNETYVGSSVRVYGTAVYNTTFGAGEPVAGADVTIEIMGQAGQWKTHTTSTGDYAFDIAPSVSGNLTVIVTVTDFTFWESVELSLSVLTLAGVDLMLSAVDISFSPLDPIEGDNVTIKAVIHNIGTEDCGNVLVRFYNGNDLIGELFTDPIPAGSSDLVSISWDAFPMGWHTINVVVDPYDVVEELNEGNNAASKKIYVYPPWPDLTPVDIIFSSCYPVVGETVTITAKVLNIGGIDAHNAKVEFLIDDYSVENQTISFVSGKGGIGMVSILYSFASAKCYAVNVTADPQNSIYEGLLGEENNWRVEIICPHSPLPDLMISSSDIAFSNNEPENGVIIVIYATVHNIGEVDAQNVTVEFYDDGTRIPPTIIVPTILAGGQQQVSVQWNATPSGWHIIRVVVDGNDTILESNENNNVASRYIHVRHELAADIYIHSEDIVLSNTNPMIGEEVTIYATVHNGGDAAAEDVVVVFYIDAVQIGSPESVASISTGGSKTFSKEWVADGRESHVIKIETDTPIEWSKSNNNATKAIIVGIHDLAATNITPSKNIVGQGFTLRINITVTNQGDYTETFNVTAYAGSTIIGTTEAIAYAGNSTTLTLTWNTTGFAKGNYQIHFSVSPVDYEVDLSNNDLADGWVMVAMVGDVTGPDGMPDEKVDIRDVAAVSIRYGTEPDITPPGRLPYDPNYDINDDGKIDITDIAIVSTHYGDIDP